MFDFGTKSSFWRIFILGWREIYLCAMISLLWRVNLVYGGIELKRLKKSGSTVIQY
jgi:hypothetical protein